MRRLSAEGEGPFSSWRQKHSFTQCLLGAERAGPRSKGMLFCLFVCLVRFIYLKELEEELFCLLANSPVGYRGWG